MKELLNPFSKQDIQALVVAVKKLQGLVKKGACFVVISESNETSAELYRDLTYSWIGLDDNHI